MSAVYRRRSAPIEAEPWKPGADMAHVSISNANRDNGSPKPGDMILRNPENADDRWLVSAVDFARAYEPEREDAGQREGRNAD